jgi:hypothetical protein
MNRIATTNSIAAIIANKVSLFIGFTIVNFDFIANKVKVAAEKIINKFDNNPEGKGLGMGMPWPSGKPKNMTKSEG